MIDSVSTGLNRFLAPGGGCRWPGAKAATNPAAQAPQQTAAALSTFQASSQTSAQLTIVTADGDRVTLSSRTSAQIGYSDYRYLHQAAGQTTSLEARATQVSFSQDLQISVEGSLSADELRDINKLVGKVDRVVRDFLRGGAGDDPGQALALDHLGSLSAVGLSVEHQESVTRSSQVALQQSGEPSAPPAGGSTGPAPSPLTGPAPAADASSASGLVDRVVAALRDGLRGSNTLDALAPTLIEQIMKGLGRTSGLHRHRALLDRVGSAVAERLRARKSDEDARAPSGSAPAA